MNLIGSFRRLAYQSRLFQRLLRQFRPLTDLRPNWSWLAENSEWQSICREARGGRRVLIATSTGGNWPCSTMESMLGVALTLRGANVRFLLCDAALPACQECDYQWLSPTHLVREGPSRVCRSCFEQSHAMLSPLGLPIDRYSQYLDNNAQPVSSLESNANSGIDEHAYAGALRYFGRGTLPDGAIGENVLAKYIEGAERTAAMMRRLVAENRPEVAVFHHGIYVPQGVVGNVLRGTGVRVVNWGPAYRKGTVIFSHGNSYHHTMMDEEPAQWSDIHWSEDEDAAVMSYLRSRWTGGNDWINFQENAEQDISIIKERLALDFSRPVIGLLTNVIWDAQLHFRQSAFPSMLDWLFASIEYFIKRSDLQLVIRIHPAEVLGTVPSRQCATDEIFGRFGVLPPHIKIIGPEEKISTYSLMALCNSVLAYGTKTALELACTGLPVVVAGEAWCRGKGFTVDVSSPDEYLLTLDRLPFSTPLTAEQITAARKYAYHFFFRRMITVRNLSPLDRFGPYAVKVSRLDDLLPGADPGLDIICDGILENKPFVI